MYRNGKDIWRKRHLAAFVFVPSVFGEKFEFWMISAETSCWENSKCLMRTFTCRSTFLYMDSGLKSGTDSLTFQYLLDHCYAYVRGGPEVDEYSLEPVPWETVQQPTSPCQHHLQATGTASIKLQIWQPQIRLRRKIKSKIFLLKAHIFGHGLNMELDLQSLFELHVTCCAHAAVLIGWNPETPPFPRHLGSYTRGAIWLAKIDDISL